MAEINSIADIQRLVQAGESDWRIIPRLESYEIDRSENVRRAIDGGAYKRGHIVRSRPDKDGYLLITLSQAGKKVHCKMHQLVMRAFVGECPSGMEVNHINGNKADNRVENLEYTTHQRNAQHAVDVLKRERAKGSRAALSKLIESDVEQIKRLLKAGNLSQRAIGALFGVRGNTICAINTGFTWKHVAIND